MSLPQYIKDIVNLTSLEEQEIGNLFYREELPKGHFLFHKGDGCRHIFYIEKGLARYYYTLYKNKEITGWFFAENAIMTAIDSFYENKPTDFNCVLLEDSVIYSINYSDWEEMLNKNNAMAKFLFRIMYEIAKKLTEFIYNTRFQTAQKRYKILIKDYPFIFQRVQLKYIASYLGITPETLSRLRSEK